MAIHYITAGTYTNYNFYHNDAIVLQGAIEIVGNFEIRTSSYINFSAATITSSGEGVITMIADGYDPSYPGITLTIDGVSYNNATAIGINCGPITAVNATVQLLANCIEPDFVKRYSVLSSITNPGSEPGVSGSPVIRCRNLLITSAGQPLSETPSKLIYANAPYLSMNGPGSISRAITGDGSYYRMVARGYTTTILAQRGEFLYRELFADSTVRTIKDSIPWKTNLTRLPSSGTITLEQIGYYFGDSQSYDLSDYYKGGPYVPQYAPKAPATGTFALPKDTGSDVGISTAFYWYNDGTGNVNAAGGSYGELRIYGKLITSVYYAGVFNGSPPLEIIHNGSRYTINSTVALAGTRAHGIAVERAINTAIPTTGEIQFSNFYNGDSWSPTASLPSVPVLLFKWYPTYIRPNGPQAPSSYRFLIDNVIVQSGNISTAVYAPPPASIIYNSETYIIDPQQLQVGLFAPSPTDEEQHYNIYKQT